MLKLAMLRANHTFTYTHKQQISHTKVLRAPSLINQKNHRLILSNTYASVPTSKIKPVIVKELVELELMTFQYAHCFSIRATGILTKSLCMFLISMVDILNGSNKSEQILQECKKLQ